MTKTNGGISPAAAAEIARAMLTDAVGLLRESGFANIRFDQWEHPTTKVMVETGYTYGETRLTVHDGGEVSDLRLTGRSSREFNRFRRLALAGM